MPLSDNDYIARARTAGLNVYFAAEMDAEYNLRKVVINPANPTQNCYSVAKGFTVTAVGMCYDRGLLTPEDKAAGFFKDRLPQGMDEKWLSVTIDHLLRHVAGFGRGLLDIDVDNASEYTTSDYLSIVLSEPLPNEPGSIRQYTDAAFYLLSRIVSRVTGMTLCDFMRPALMGTMHFKELAWSVCPEGYSMGATGLYLRTEDMVKLGALYLNNGVWRGERIVSEEWVKLVLSHGYEFVPKGGGWYGKGGMRGQMLAFNYEKGLAVAWHSFEAKVPFNVMLDGV